MTQEDSPDNSFRYEMPIVRVPDPPSDLSYAEFEDFRQREILKANAIPVTEPDLLHVLKNEKSILQATAAHTLGVMGSVAAMPMLKTLLTSTEDLVRVAAAYGLARNGISEGKESLVQLLSYPIEAYLFPPIAAGYLAQLGDPQGYKIVVRCLESENPAVRMLGCKQVYFFSKFQGLQDADKNTIDVYPQFERALNDSDTNIQWQALVQLREIKTPETRRLLESYLESASDESLREFARRMLSGRQQ
jgi:HEAT repeat protein